MEILAALLVGIVGGYLLVSYYLLIAAITAKTKKRKWIGLAMFAIWVLVPFINEAIDDIRLSWHQHKLEETEPSEEMVKEVYKKINSPFIQLPSDFYSYQDQELTIKVDTLEDDFIRYAQSTYKDLLEEIGNDDTERIDEYMIEDVIGKYLLETFSPHREIWNRTTAPRKITFELYFHNELILKSTSTNSLEFQQDRDLTIEKFYKKIKPSLIKLS